MRPILVAAMSGLLVLAGACSRYGVDTTVSPDARFTGYHTFTVLPVPRANDGYARTAVDDPMARNSQANIALRQAVIQVLVDRGYRVDDRNPDFAVALYGSAREPLDIAIWNYNYQQFATGTHATPFSTHPATYPPGTVVMDVVGQTGSERLLVWRGWSTAKITDDPMQNVHAFIKVGTAIAERFPAAAGHTVATR